MEWIILFLPTMSTQERSDDDRPTTVDHSSPLTGKGRIVLLTLGAIVFANIYFPHLLVEQKAEEWYEPLWVTPEDYREYLLRVIEETPSSRVIWGFGGEKNLQTTADSIQNEIYMQYPTSCMMWIDSTRFNWETQQEIFDLMPCEKEAILLQVEGNLQDKEMLKFIEAIVNAPPIVHYNGKKTKSVPVTVIGYTSIPKADIRIADEIVQETVCGSWGQEFLQQFVSVLVVS